VIEEQAISSQHSVTYRYSNKAEVSR